MQAGKQLGQVQQMLPWNPHLQMHLCSLQRQLQHAVASMQDSCAGIVTSQAYEPMCEAMSNSHRSPDQQASRTWLSDQKTDADSTTEERAAQGQHMSRAMSLKGAAAADTALAFSRLRSRAGSFPVEQQLQPTHPHASIFGQPAAAAAPAVRAPVYPAQQQQRQQTGGAIQNRY